MDKNNSIDAILSDIDKVPVVLPNLAELIPKDDNYNLFQNSNKNPSQIIGLADISVVKTPSSNTVISGSQVTYTIVVSNAGPSSAENVILIDLLEACLLDKEYSLDEGKNWKPWLGFINLNTILPTKSLTVLIRCTISKTCIGNVSNTAIVISSTLDLKPSNNISSTCIAVKTVDLDILKISNKTNAIVGDTIRYTLIVKNIGTIDLNNIIIKDTLTKDLEYTGNLIINNSNVTANITLGVNIGTLKPKETSIISFDAKIISKPSSGEIVNEATSNFSYTVDKEALTGTSSSNENTINVYNVDVTLTKTCDKRCAVVGDTLNYTVLIKNSGDLNALNVVFKDKLPHEVKLIENSFTVDSNIIRDVNLSKGVSLGTVATGQTVVIIYKVKVICGSRNTIKNCALAKFESTLPNDEIITSHTPITENNSASVYINLYIPKKLNLDDTISLPYNKPIIENVNFMDCEIEDLHHSIIRDPYTHFKQQLLVEGILRETIYYNNFNSSNDFSNYIEHYIPFKTCILIPKNSYIDNLNLSGVVLCHYYKLLNSKCIRTCVSILLSLTEKC